MGFFDLFGGNTTSQNISNTSNITNTSSTDIAKTFNAMFTQNITSAPNPTQGAVSNIANAYATTLMGLSNGASNLTGALSANLYPTASGSGFSPMFVILIVIGVIWLMRK
jgi:hypothetical protein